MEWYKEYFAMIWGNSLSDINSVSLDDLHEYNSRPTESVLELLYSKRDETIVFYGATGKWMSDLAEMLLRAILELIQQAGRYI